ncbi:hypothetical protein [Methylosinus sp. PW1]|uniref:hypothetical protein n=1 Tax=Methylosinus sp. PW1 TaxID=107636 RepID=UPI001FD99D58|nr:hypothetical protein [Methylosinus sp. PW1]
MTNNIQLKRVISPISVADNTAQVGQIIDRLGYDAVTYIINLGSIADADATFVALLEEGDAANLSDAAAVADADMISQTSGTAPEAAASFQYDSDNQVRKLGYVGNKRYTRLTITPANNASAALFSASAVLSHSHIAPVTQATS